MTYLPGDKVWVKRANTMWWPAWVIDESDSPLKKVKGDNIYVKYPCEVKYERISNLRRLAAFDCELAGTFTDAAKNLCTTRRGNHCSILFEKALTSLLESSPSLDNNSNILDNSLNSSTSETTPVKYPFSPLPVSTPGEKMESSILKRELSLDIELPEIRARKRPRHSIGTTSTPVKCRVSPRARGSTRSCTQTISDTSREGNTSLQTDNSLTDDENIKLGRAKRNSGQYTKIRMEENSADDSFHSSKSSAKKKSNCNSKKRIVKGNSGKKKAKKEEETKPEFTPGESGHKCTSETREKRVKKNLIKNLESVKSEKKTTNAVSTIIVAELDEDAMVSKPTLVGLTHCDVRSSSQSTATSDTISSPFIMRISDEVSDVIHTADDLRTLADNVAWTADNDVTRTDVIVTRTVDDVTPIADEFTRTTAVDDVIWSGDDVTRTADGSGKCTADVSDSDEDELPVFSSQSPSKNDTPTFKRGDIVWAKFPRHPWWPAVVRTVYFKRSKLDRISVYFVGYDYDLKKHGFRFKYSPLKIKHFCTEERNNLYASNIPPLDVAVSQVDGYFRNKALGKCSQTTLDYFKVEDFIEDELSESGSSMAGSLPTCDDVTIVEHVTSDDNDDDVDVTYDERENHGMEMPRLVKESLRKSREKTRCLVNYISTPECRRHLLSIIRAETPSERHEHFKQKADQCKNGLSGFIEMGLGCFGPIDDDDQVLEVFQLVMSVCEEVKYLSLFDRPAYVQTVLAPEAVVYAMRRVHKYSSKRAWDIFTRGRRQTKAELDFHHKQILASAGKIDSQDKEVYRASAERRWQRLQERYMNM